MKEHIDTTGGYLTIDGVEVKGISAGSLPFPKPKRSTKEVTTTKHFVIKKGLKLLDPGSASFSGIYIPGDPGQQKCIDASEDGQEHVIQVIVPESGLVFEYQAFVSTDYPSEEDTNTLSFNVDLECTGEFGRSTGFAGITSIAGSGAGIAHYPSNAATALGINDNNVILQEASGVATDSIKVTASTASYIGISYNGGSTYTQLTSGSASSIPSAYYPSVGKLTQALVMVKEDDKATRFVDVFFARASA